MTRQANTAAEVRRKAESETLSVAVDFSPILRYGETITGTPTVAEIVEGGGAGDLTISNVQKNAAAMTINDNSVAIGKAVAFDVAGGDADTTYALRITASTTLNATRIARIYLEVTED